MIWISFSCSQRRDSGLERPTNATSNREPPWRYWVKCVKDWNRRKEVAKRTITNAQVRARYDRDSELGLANAYTNLGVALYRLKRLEEAFKQFEIASEVYGQLFKVYPSDRSIQDGKAISLVNLARVHYNRKQWNRAELAYTEARGIWEPLVSAGAAALSTDPKLFDYKFNLADCLHFLGGIKLEASEDGAAKGRPKAETDRSLAEALALYDDEAKLRASLPEVFSPPGRRSKFLECLTALAYVAQNLKQPGRVEAALTQARPIALDLLATATDTTRAGLREKLLTADTELVDFCMRKARESRDPRKAIDQSNVEVATLNDEIIKHRLAAAKDASGAYDAFAWLGYAYKSKAQWIRDLGGFLDGTGCEASLEPFNEAIKAYKTAEASASTTADKDAVRSALRQTYMGRAIALTRLGRRTALEDWQRVRRLPGPKDDIVIIRLGEANVNAASHNHRLAACEADKLDAEHLVQVTNQIELTTIYCRCAAALSNDTTLPADAKLWLRELYLGKAWEHLKRADDGGALSDFRDIEAMLASADFAPLREFGPARSRLQELGRNLAAMTHVK